MAEQLELEQLARCMYEEAFSRLGERRAGEAKITALIGPPLARPDVFLVSYQGGGEDRSRSCPTWPERLIYLDDDYRYGRRLRREFCRAGLFETLEKRTVAMAACFPEAGESEADQVEWRAFSTKWVKRMLRATRPRVVLVFGSKASDALGLEDKWCHVKRGPGRRGKVYGRTKIECSPAVYCHDLPRASTNDVQECLVEVKRLVDAGATNDK